MAISSSSSVMPPVDEALELRADEAGDLAGVLGHRPGVDRPGAGVGVRRRRRVHAVGEAAALADLVEQPARQPAAEDVVDDVERLAVGVVARHGPAADGEVHLLGVVVDLDVGLGRRRAPSGRCDRRRPASPANAVLDGGDDLVVVDVAGDGDRRRAGAVVGGEEVADVGRLRRAAPSPARRPCPGPRPWSPNSWRVERAQGDVVGRVVVHRQLLEDHLALALDVVVGDQRVRQHVAEQLDAGRPVALGIRQ